MRTKAMPWFAALCTAVSLTAFFTCNIFAVLITAAVSVLLILCFNKPDILLFCVAAASVLSSVTALNDIQSYEKLNESSAYAEYTVIEEPVKQKYGYSVSIRVKGKNLPFNSKVKLYSYQKLKAGTVYSGRLSLRAVKNNKAYYYAKDTFATAVPESRPIPLKNDKFYYSLNKMRRGITKSLYSNMSPESAATMNALTVGERKGFSDYFAESVRKAGVSHVTVVSGLHLAIIMGAVTVLLGQIFDNKYLKAAFALITVAGLSALCGFTVSILRAGITYVFMALAPVFNRNGNPFCNLCAAVTLILIISPFAISGISFQLSVLSTYGILVLSPKITRKYKLLTNTHYKFYNYTKGIAGILAQTLSAAFLTTPAVVYHFSQISLIAPATNILITQAVSADLVICAMALLIDALPFSGLFAKPLFFFSEMLTKYINFIILKFGNFRYSAANLDYRFAYIIAIPVVLTVFLLYFYDFYAYRKQSHRIKKECFYAGDI